MNLEEERRVARANMLQREGRQKKSVNYTLSFSSMHLGKAHEQV